MNQSTRQIELYTVAAKLPIVPLAVFLSCLFSLIVILQNPLLNDDAYKYLRAAEVFNADGALAMLEAFPWFHYSVLIAFVDRVLPGGLVVAAHTLNTALYALLIYSFLLLVRELRDTPRVRLFAAICILVLPLTNQMRYFLIRDIGFWAFALLSLVYLIRHNRSGATGMAFRWSITLVAASAFRLEGLLLMALAPWSLLLPDPALPLQERATRCGRLVGILAAVVLAVMLVAMLAGLSLPDLIGSAYRWYLPLLGNLAEVLNGTAGAVGAALFTADNFPGSDSTGLVLVITLFGYCLALLMNLVSALGFPAIVLLLAGRLFPSASALPVQAKRALQAYIAISVLALLLFMLIMRFTTDRYATLLALLLLTLAPLILDELYTRAQNSQKLLKIFHVYSGVFFLFFLADSLLSFGYSQQHIEEGIAWARAELPTGTPMRTNNFAIAYESGHVIDYDQTLRDAASVAASSQQGDYLLLEVDRDDVGNPDFAFDQRNDNLHELKRFSNENLDQVRVYVHQ